jgi:predicted alpha/beta-hydrolase family hydrolase
MTTTWRVDTGKHRVTARSDAPADSDKGCVLVLAHGAGGHMSDAGMTGLASLYVSGGFRVIRFNFPYREAGSHRPDPMPVLQRCVRDVVASARERFVAQRWIVGGRSMGGRAASMVAAEGFDCDGLVLLAYPLHPAGAVEKLRDAHLKRIDVPVLCMNGTRDSLCRRDLMDRVVAQLPDRFTMHWIEGADHSFRVLKTAARGSADVLREILDTTLGWYASWLQPNRT